MYAASTMAPVQRVLAVYFMYIQFIAEVQAGQSKMFQRSDMDNLSFLADILFQSATRSVLHCASLCSSDTQCVTFTFTARLPDGSCLGYSSVITADTIRMSSLGSKTFAVALSGLQCGDPPEVDMAVHLEVTSSQVGTVLDYQCSSSGVMLYWPANVTCQADTTWTPPTFSCVDCKTTIISVTGNSGTLTSPGYPGKYTHNLNCIYTVTLDQAGPQQVTITIDYNLVKQDNCFYDFLEIENDGIRYCGLGSETKVISVQEHTWSFRFVTDSVVVKDKGFVVRYHV